MSAIHTLINQSSILQDNSALKKQKIYKISPNIRASEANANNRTALTPLCSEERIMAEENHYLVLSFLRKHGLPENEYYDVVIFRYLLAVKKWFRRPDLKRYKFSTIAWYAMRSALCHEREKQRRRISTISLDDAIPGYEALSWNEVITGKNLCYTPYTNLTCKY